jgi:threonine dehydratase
MTFALCQEVVDDWVVIPEDEIGRVLREFVIDHDMPIEGAAAVAVAAAIRLAPKSAWRRIGIVICGGNIAAETLATVMDGRSPV